VRFPDCATSTQRLRGLRNASANGHQLAFALFRHMQHTRRNRTLKIALLPSDPYESAKIAGLRYVTDSMPGITRRRSGTGFIYISPDGQLVRDKEELRRIRSLVIPPAWTDVWICPAKSGHLQAVGIDARGRKQYRYHPIYRQVRDATKFKRMIAFGLALPKIRLRVAQDLQADGMPKHKVLATVVQLLATTSIRVGNEEYRKQNDSIGLTTMENKHVEVEGRTLRFHFKGKSGQVHDIKLTDRKLARIVAECQEIPGHELFQYLDETGEASKVTSDDVNQYLREITDEDFTAKDFRTWNGSRETTLALEALGPAESESAAKKNIVEAVKQTAKRLGNRPATCRKYYVHPAVLDGYMDGALFEVLREAKAQDDPNGLSREEVALMQLLALYVPKASRKATKDEDLPQMLKRSVAQVSVMEIQVVPAAS
jgi:DNA topoisomerase I